MVGTTPRLAVPACRWGNDRSASDPRRGQSRYRHLDYVMCGCGPRQVEAGGLRRGFLGFC